MLFSSPPLKATRSSQLLLPAHFQAMVVINYEMEDSELFCPILTQQSFEGITQNCIKKLLFSPGMTRLGLLFVLEGQSLQGLN